MVNTDVRGRSCVPAGKAPVVMAVGGIPTIAFAASAGQQGVVFAPAFKVIVDKLAPQVRMNSHLAFAQKLRNCFRPI